METYYSFKEDREVKEVSGICEGTQRRAVKGVKREIEANFLYKLKERKTWPLVDKEGNEVGNIYFTNNSVHLKTSKYDIYIGERSRDDEKWWAAEKMKTDDISLKMSEIFRNNPALIEKCRAGGKKKKTKKGPQAKRRPYNIPSRP